MSENAMSPHALALWMRSVIRTTRVDALRIGVIRRIIHDFATTAAYCEPSVYRWDERKKKIQPDHPVSRLLAEPCEELSTFEFYRTLFTRYFVRQNSFAEVLRTPAGEPAELVLPLDNSVRVRRAPDGCIEYLSRDGDSLGYRDILHFRGLGLDGFEGRELFGDSLETEVADAALQYAAAYFRNGAKIDGFFSSKTPISPDERNQIQRIIDATTSTENSHVPLILGADVTWNSMSSSPIDSQLLQSRKASVEDIARLTGYPLKKLTGATDDDARQEFVEALRLHLEVFEAELGHKLLSREERLAGYGVEFNLRMLRRSQDTAKADSFAKFQDRGVWTPNEAREEVLNLEPLDDPKADVPLVGVNNLAGIGTVEDAPDLKPLGEVKAKARPQDDYHNYNLIRPVLEDVVGRVYRRASKAVAKSADNLEAEKAHIGEVCPPYAALAGVTCEAFVAAVMDGIGRNAEPADIVQYILGGIGG